MIYWYYRLGRKQVGPVSIETLFDLIKAGTVRPHTMLWHSGLPYWHKASEISELVEPLSAGPAASAMQERDPTLAGPWPRLWARMFDVGILALVLGPAGDYFLRNYFPSALPTIAAVSRVLPGVLMFPAAAVILALVMTIFGTTPGKAIAGIKVERLSKDRPLRFYLSREFGQWIFGAGLGIPLVSLITHILQFRRVRAGRPAFYDEDEGVFVRGTGSLARSGTIAAATVALFLGIGIANMPDRKPASVKLATQAWTNPMTGRNTQLTGSWSFEELKSDFGKVYYFDSNDSQSGVVFGYEPLDETGIDPIAYGKALGEAFEDDIAVDTEWEPITVEGFAAAKARGTQKNVDPKKITEAHVEITVVVMGQSAWRMLLFVQNRPMEEFLGREMLMRSLLSTAKDINIPTNMPCDWDRCFSLLLKKGVHPAS